MKDTIIVLILILLASLAYFYRDTISDYITEKYLIKKEIEVKPIEEKYKINKKNVTNYNDEYIPKDKDSLINIIYTIVDNGWNDFDFFCEKEYKNCISDLKNIMNDEAIISDIKNIVHPYNTYSTLSVNFDNYGRIKMIVNKIYNDDEIEIINNKVDEIYNNLITENMSDREKIKVIHDYIINNTVYDQTKADYITGKINYDSLYKSDTAYGVINDGYGICSGYSDLMAIFLDKMNIQNYRLASENHIWNYVYIDNTWLHLDLTWDDPITSNNENLLLYNVFLITDYELKKVDTLNHTFNKNVFVQ